MNTPASNDSPPKPKRKYKPRMTAEEKEILELYRKAKRGYQDFLDKFHLEKQGEIRESVIKKVTENCPFHEDCPWRKKENKA